MDLLKEVLKDKELASLVKDMTSEELEDNLLSLYTQKKENDICLSCKGKDVCKMDPEYFQTYLVKNGSFVFKNHKPCKFKKKIMHCLYMNNYSDSGELFKNDNRIQILSEMLRACKGGKGIYLHGSYGSGKTYLMMRLANEISKEKEVYFVYYPELVNKVKSCIARGDNSFDKTIEVLKNADVLFLDDIGSESVSEFVRDDILFRILDYRMDNKMITIFTSNLNKSDLLKHYQYDRKEKANLMNAKRLIERIDILADDYVLSGSNLRRDK